MNKSTRSRVVLLTLTDKEKAMLEYLASAAEDSLVSVLRRLIREEYARVGAGHA